MSEKLKGKVAVVTGASSGIGEATAIALAAEGAKVVVAARRSERLEALTQRIRDMGGEVLPIPTDVANSAQMSEMVNTAHSKFGTVDILVNNAGISLNGPISGADSEDWRRMVDTDLLGMLYGVQAALPIMKAQGSGHIVNVSSGTGRWLFPSAPVYSGIKFAVSNMTEMLRQEVGKEQIRVTCIEPGLVKTKSLLT